MIKNMINTINTALFNEEMTIDVALQLLNHLSTLTGKKYGVNARRAVTVDDDGRMHDAYTNA